MNRLTIILLYIILGVGMTLGIIYAPRDTPSSGAQYMSSISKTVIINETTQYAPVKNGLYRKIENWEVSSDVPLDNGLMELSNNNNTEIEDENGNVMSVAEYQKEEKDLYRKHEALAGHGHTLEQAVKEYARKNIHE